MLTNDTKRKIDSARDILVGKVPDPKAQVDQITNALIYKFMDDMDQESIELGGKSRYFTNGYEKYSWTKLMDPKLGGLERLDLYVEAIGKLSQNPHLPQLFRDIFKDAFLPYRDPETLSLFLKQINEFTYHHSEELGNSFEYLLSILGSQGDAGQFRTPRHIIDFIVAVVDPKKTDRILDPACGTAGFLISAYKHILASHDGKDESGKPNEESRLSPDERKRLVKSVVGYDISPDMVKLSRVNMYLHGFPEPHIFEYDTLTSEDNWDESFDVILANPPFMSPKGGIRPHKRFSVQANRSEVLFVDYIAEHLTPNGRAGIIVPEGVIFQSGAAYKQLRKMLVENHLFAVVSLPAGVFLPYSGVKTSILFLDPELAKQSKNILFVNISNVGTGLGAQRRPISGNELQPAAALIERFKENTDLDVQAIKNTANTSKSFFTIGLSTIGGLDTIGSPSEVNDLDALVVPKQEIAETTDYNLTGERYRKVIASEGSWPKIKLAELIEESTERLGNAQKPVWSVSNTGGFVKAESQFKHRVASENTSNYKLVKEGYCAFNPSRINVGSIALNTLDEQGAVSPMYVVFQIDTKKIDPQYLFSLLKSEVFNELVKKYAQGAVRQQLRFKDLINIEIPMPPLEAQKEVVAVIDGYQKIIDASRTIIERWKPILEFSPDWKKVKLSELIKELETGVSVNSENRPRTEGEKGILKTSAVTYGVFNPNENKRILESELKRAKTAPRKNSILVSRMNTPQLVGATAYIDRDWDDLYLPDRLWQTVWARDDFSPRYVFYVISSPEFRNLITSISGGTSGSMKNISKGAFLNIEIPLPPLEKQQAIVDEVETERVIVDNNKNLLNIYKRKVAEKLAEVWG